MAKSNMHVEQDPEAFRSGGVQKNLDDDGRVKRTVLAAFSFITYFSSTLLADCYRSPDPITGERNYTYMDVVRAHLGGRKVQLCGLAQYGNLVGITIGYTITASISMVFRTFLVILPKSNYFHKNGHEVKSVGETSNYPFMIIFACIQIVLSQIPDFHKLSWLSIVAAVMSFAYASIGVGLSIAKVAAGCSKRWPNNTLITREIPVDIPGYGIYHINLFRLIWRTVYVIVTAVIAMILPFFNDFLGLIGAASFWPLTMYFPVEMYIARTNMRKFFFTWTWLKILSWACLVVSLVAAAGSVQGLIQSLKTYKPFKTQ
ncbi:hypothetical protein EUGRSUZ_F02189 [Eucalyptus grandis]|uniref:Uncharacterized protein n=1 Tax=Eucalyptus grandis TaxID=71139 RepID=A0ACC3KJD7_EUCGR|nr:hypothetical protein EUGRSUZ_F02189 [Eucalyptus grandis]